jgi:predicted RNA-binding protein Jag
MNPIIEKTKEIITLLGYPEAEVAVDEDRRKVIVLIDDRFVSENVETILPAIDHIVNIVLKKEGLIPHIVDLNYYRKERERLISELVKAAARKATITKQEVELPAMNGYERRLVHMEITEHPELKTESTGMGKERRVVIKFVS